MIFAPVISRTSVSLSPRMRKEPDPDITNQEMKGRYFLCPDWSVCSYFTLRVGFPNAPHKNTSDSSARSEAIIQSSSYRGRVSRVWMFGLLDLDGRGRTTDVVERK